jgi:alkylation response protein AidB-like acyl-CoA dehydrogenase
MTIGSPAIREDRRLTAVKLTFYQFVEDVLDAFSQGRADLAAWLDEQPRSFFEADTALQALWAATSTGHEQRQRRDGVLRAFGAAAAGPLDAAVRENNLPRNLPVLEPYDGLGRPLGRIANHPSFDEAGRIIYGTGMMAAYRETPPPHRYVGALFYLAAHTGENGHSSRTAATAGAIRALQGLGTPEQKARYLPRLFDPSWDTSWTCGQYLTEVQGGSDVGTNGTVAVRAPDGTWRLHGEKWFCSNVDGDLFLVTARPEGAPAGTRGLGMFLMPARLDDGAPNAVRVRRLKEKLGTRTMPSGEVDLAGAWAEALGPVERGLQNMFELVIGTSRLFNDFLCAGMAHRAYLVASGFAAHRRAFGQPIAGYPLVRCALASMLADAEACLAGAWLLAGLQERCDAGSATEDERAFVRLGVTVTKVHTAMLTHDVVRRGIEVLGGNGTIETFSVLPRLLCDTVVAENWEGTPNVLFLQALRDCKRLALHRGFFAVAAAALGEEAVSGVRAELEEALAADEEVASLLFRPVADRLAALVYLTGLAPLAGEAIVRRARLTRARHLEHGLDAAHLRLAHDCL